MQLRQMVHDPSVSIHQIGAWLDGLSHDERLAAMYTLRRKDQRVLFDKCDATTPIGEDFYVPPGTPDLTQVIHYGINTLPLFRKFQKRFCRSGSDIVGYNEGFTRPIIGPGYYVAHTTDGNDAWLQRGPYVVDYFMIPTGEVAPGWPRVKPNSQGLQFLVYNHTRDFMRRVSSHMSIGVAFKNETALGAWFVLCRQP